MRTLLLVFLSIITTGSIAADWKPLEGVYALTAEPYLGPPSHDRKQSHFNLHLTGESARDLYHAINAEDMIDECSGVPSKQMSNIKCLYFKKDDQYECRFSINLRDNSIDDQSVAC